MTSFQKITSLAKPSSARMAQVISLLGLTLVFLALMLQSPPGFAQVDSGFDHAATAFPLSGLHEQVRCESCHIKGIFKTTPRDCSGCHVQGNQRGAKAKPVNHIQSSNNCEDCHTTATFSVSRFNHSTVSQGTCVVCHDGRRAPGMSANHIQTSLSCDKCHATSAFKPVLHFDHSVLGGVTNTCATCHDGTHAKGQPANHLPRSAASLCGTCHVASTMTDFVSFAGGQMDHTGLTTGCADCHGPNVVAGTFAGVSNIIVMPPTSPAGAGAHIPSSTACESCHLASVPQVAVPANAVAGVPGSGFATPVPSGVQIHAGVTGGCSNCHETNFTWLGMSNYPATPTTFIAKEKYRGFQTRPTAAGGQFAVADAAHPGPGTGDCADCHAGTTYFNGEVKPANHIPTAAGASCIACHTNSDYAVVPTLTSTHKYAPSSTGNCLQCHGNAALNGGQPASYYAIPAINFNIKALPDNHVPYTSGQECQVCHTSIGTPVTDGATFANSKMVHAATNSSCETCHGSTVTGSTFAGVSAIVVLPSTASPGANSHMPLGTVTDCAKCHVLTSPAAAMAPVATSTTAGSTGFYPGSITSRPTSAQVHAGITAGNCNQCHADGMTWLSVTGPYPMTPKVLTAGVTTYNGFQTLPKTLGSATNINDALHPGASAGDCSKCHTSTDAFTLANLTPPTNHIPYATTAACGACHKVADWTTMPALTDIHANTTTASKCADCHAKAVAGTFASSMALVADGANHLPFAGDCAACHVGTGSSIAALPVKNGAKFSGSAMAHAATTSTCETCHGATVTGTTFQGVTKIVVLPPTSPAGVNSHIPTTAACDQCHSISTLAALVPGVATKTAPGTAFATPVPNTTQIHAGIAGNCVQCHDTNLIWMGMDRYPISPTVKGTVASTKYTGFHSRPVGTGGAHTIADPNHPVGECGDCHGSFDAWSGVDTPINHIPFAATAQCSACHTSTNFALIPTVTNIHNNAQSKTGNCLQCHGNAAMNGGKPASYYTISSVGFSIKGLPDTHLPYSTSQECMVCHTSITTPVTDGASFASAKMVHTAASSIACATCHGPTISNTTYYGVTNIVVLPSGTAAGASSHIPLVGTNTACGACHVLSAPATAMAPAATSTTPGTTGFYPGSVTSAPTSAQVHAGITSNCNQCHADGMTWLSVTGPYPMTPSVLTSGVYSYKGFQTLPKTAGSATNINDSYHPAASAGDCSACHSSTDAFGVVAPPKHIAYLSGTACITCHTVPDWSVMPALTPIHANTVAGATCASCHAKAVAGTFASSAAFKADAGNHISFSGDCAACHVASLNLAGKVGNGASFGGASMAHTATAATCATCHGTGVMGSSFQGVISLVTMPVTSPAGVSSHIPTNAACDQCHKLTGVPALVPAVAANAAGSGATWFGTAAAVLPTSANIHATMTGGCMSCHEANYTWMGMTAYPTSVVNTDQYRGFQTRPTPTGGGNSVMDGGHIGNAATNDCQTCHSEALGFVYFSAAAKPANHIPYATTAACGSCHVGGNYAVIPSVTNIHKYAQSTTGNCLQCHGNATLNGGQPASFYAIPSSNFSIVALPTNHVPYTSGQECQVCHTSITTPVTTGATFTNSKMVHAATSSACSVCHGSGVTNTTFAGVSKIVVLPATSPAGVNSHMPLGTVTNCDACHVLTTPTAALAGVAASTTPGSTGFYPGSVTGKPTSTQVHAGITANNCNQCHADGMVWMSVTGPYPMTPGVLTAGTAAYNGFQTLPKSTGSATNISDAYHPAASAGDCSVCHTGTASFGLPVPTKHMPYLSGTACATCHTTANWATMPALTPIHANTVAGATCASCHAKAVAGTFLSSVAFMADGANHLSFSGDCAACHVGTGSSIAALPVVNGAKFSGSAMNHAATTASCATCHGTGITGTSFQGVTSIVVLPPTSPMGVSSHVPTTAACDVCHKLTGVPTLVPGVATKAAGTGITLFGTSAAVLPSTNMIHAGLTTSCMACHEGNYQWMGMSAYPVNTNAINASSSFQYTGFQTRPTAAGGSNSVADSGHATGDKATLDCSNCHGEAMAFQYFTAQAKPAGHYPDSQILSTASCANCHGTSGDYSKAGLVTPATLHSYFSATVMKTCNTCHLSTSAKVAGCDTQAACTSPPPVTWLPTLMPLASGGSPTVANVLTHIPTGTIDCINCHVATNPTFGGTVMQGNATMHTSVKNQTCMSCHERNYWWYGYTRAQNVSPYFNRIVKNENGHATSDVGKTDCAGCHSSTTTRFVGNRAVVRPVLRSAVVGSRPRLMPDGLAQPSTDAAGNAVFDHRGVLPGDCASCHNGQMAKGLPVKHLVSKASCDSCHRTTAWKPADFSHQGVPMGQCQVCHNGQNGPGKPGGHFVTSRACDACHKVVGWLPVMYSHTSPQYVAQPDKTTCLSCHVTNGEIIPRQMRGGPRPRPQ